MFSVGCQKTPTIQVGIVVQLGPYLDYLGFPLLGHFKFDTRYLVRNQTLNLVDDGVKNSSHGRSAVFGSAHRNTPTL